MANIGFVGLGVMGSRMVNRLLDKGHTVTGFNRTRSKAQWLIDRGMKWADSPRAVAAAADFTLSMVTNSAALQEIADGPNGMISGLGSGKIWIEMSTVSPEISKALAARVREKGADMLDAPVSGSVITLEQGKLSVMAGGHVETFERAKTILLDLGPKVTHVGENGLALVMKIATNLKLAVQMLAFSEGVLLAEKSGIPRDIAVDVLTHSAIASPMVQYRGPFVLKMPEEAWFNVNMMQKDMLLALELGRKADVPLPTTATANEYLTAARAMGSRSRISPSYLRYWRECLEFPNDTAVNPSSRIEPARTCTHMYRRMLMIRLFEEQVNDLYTRALMPGLAHLYIGEEAVAVGCAKRSARTITSPARIADMAIAWPKARMST